MPMLLNLEKRKRSSSLVSLCVSLGAVLYPLIVYGALQVVEPTIIGCVAIVAVLLYAFLQKQNGEEKFQWPLFIIASNLIAAAIFNRSEFLLLHPVLINAGLFSIFYLSLSQECSIIERFARLQRSVIPPSAKRYCRQVTKIWMAFFLFNCIFVTYLGLFVSYEYWALYTGCGSYVFAGLLFMLEFLYRQTKEKQFQLEAAAFTDTGSSASSSDWGCYFSSLATSWESPPAGSIPTPGGSFPSPRS